MNFVAESVNLFYSCVGWLYKGISLDKVNTVLFLDVFPDVFLDVFLGSIGPKLIESFSKSSSTTKISLSSDFFL